MKTVPRLFVLLAVLAGGFAAPVSAALTDPAQIQTEAYVNLVQADQSLDAGRLDEALTQYKAARDYYLSSPRISPAGSRASSSTARPIATTRSPTSSAAKPAASRKNSPNCNRRRRKLRPSRFPCRTSPNRPNRKKRPSPKKRRRKPYAIAFQKAGHFARLFYCPYARRIFSLKRPTPGCVRLFALLAARPTSVRSDRPVQAVRRDARVPRCVRHRGPGFHQRASPSTGDGR